MTKQSKIEWTDHTWNPWTGCIKVSQGCKFCYMYRDKERYGLDPSEVIKSAHRTFVAPVFWKDPALVFTCSWSDFFIEDADQWRPAAWDIIRKTPHLTYQILTKRPERIYDNLPPDWGNGYPNVWLGTSIENQEVARERNLQLHRVPAAVHFLSIEPLLGPVTLKGLIPPDWVIIGGESGNDTGAYRYRPCEYEWIVTLVFECRQSRIPVFVKQLGTYLSKEIRVTDRHGKNINEFPVLIQRREFPIGFDRDQNVQFQIQST